MANRLINRNKKRGGVAPTLPLGFKVLRPDVTQFYGPGERKPRSAGFGPIFVANAGRLVIC